MRNTVDVVVVGGGPAGLAAAERAAANGLDVLVLERQREIGEHVRTSGMTARATVDRLDAPAHTFHTIERIRFVGPTQEATVPVADAVCVLEVRSFYRWLGERAVTAGAQIELGAGADGVIRDASGAVVGAVYGGREVRAKVVVDASGYRATLSRKARLHPGFRRFGVGVEHELEAPAANPGTAVLIVGSDYAPTGYAWSFPCGAGRVRVGVGLHHSDTREDPARFVRSIVSDQRRLQLGLDNAVLVETHRGLIPAELPTGAVVSAGLVAVGDAAAQASLVAGEGIRLAIEAGEVAGDVVAEAIRAGDVGSSALSRYEREFARRHGRSLRVGARLNRRLAGTNDAHQWDRRIEGIASMPAGLVVPLLQSQLPVAPLLRWTWRHPRPAARLLYGAAGGYTSRPWGCARAAKGNGL